MSSLNKITGLIVWLILLCPLHLYAGSGCEQGELTPEQLRNGMTMAYRTWQVLEGSNAKVAIVSRVGSDLSEHGLRYSHLGLVMRDHPKGKWIFTHELNRCATNSSALFDEGLGNFYLDNPYQYESLITVPDMELQQKLAELMLGAMPMKMHEAKYSMIAHPFSTKYQNSNQWVLELIAVALADKGVVNNRKQAQDFLKQQNYQPDPIAISAVKRLGAGLFSSNVEFDDHSWSEQRDKSYQVVTVRSLVRFLEQKGRVILKKVIPLEGEIRDASPGFG